MREGSAEIVQLLLDHGADVNAWYYLGEGESRQKFNALKWAVGNGHEEVAEILRRHGAVMPDAESAALDAKAASNASSEIVEYFGKNVGPVEELTLREIVPDSVSITVHVVPPTPGRDEITLFTTGMSDLPMNVPEAPRRSAMPS